MQDDPETLARRCGTAMYDADRASQYLGIALERMEAGRAVMQMTVAEWMVNGLGVCHGGLIFSLADSACAFAANSRDEPQVLSNASVDLLRPTVAGDKLRVVAKERSRTARTALIDGIVTNQRDETVALFRGRVHKVRGSVLGGIERSTSVPSDK